MAEIIRGTEIKFNLNIQPISGISMSTFDFYVMAYAQGTPQRSVVNKFDCTKVNNDNYTLPVDTAPLGLGLLILDVYAFVPDQDFPDDLRTEICRIETDITITD